ncbi:MAG: alkaline phosphatase family protein [Thermincolia bacterium]
MKIGRKIFIWLIMCVYWLGLATPVLARNLEGPGSQPPPSPNYAKHIFVFIVPGLTESVLINQYLPNIKGLIGEGTKAQGVIGDSVPVRGKELSSILLGNSEIQAKEAKNSKILAQLIGKSQEDVYIIDGEEIKDRWQISFAMEKYKKDKPFFNAIIFPEQINRQKSYQDIDRQIGKVISLLREYGVLDYSMVAVTGINNQIKGDEKSKSQGLMGLVMRGPNIKSGQEIPLTHQVDIMPTLFYASQYKELPNTEGFVIWNALKAKSISAENDFLNRRIKDLSERQYKQFSNISKMFREREHYRQETVEFNRDKENIKALNQQKDKLINQQKTEIKLYQWGFLALFLLAIMGYIVEYYHLRKRFLMF